MIRSALTLVLNRFKEIYPIIGITGPRQSIKATLAQHVFPHLSEERGQLKQSTLIPFFDTADIGN